MIVFDEKMFWRLLLLHVRKEASVMIYRGIFDAITDASSTYFTVTRCQKHGTKYVEDAED